MLNPEGLIGMPVVAVAEARKLGYVRDLLFGMDPLGVRALRIEGEAGDSVLPFEAIATIGPDAITVGDQRTAEASAGATGGEVLNRDALRSLKIVDEAGVFLGTVKSVQIQRDSGQIARLTVEQGGMLGVGAQVRTFDAAAIRRVGEELVTVTEAAAR